jgi:hypothetical protein
MPHWFSTVLVSRDAMLGWFKAKVWVPFITACHQTATWLSHKPPEEDHIQFGLQELEVSLVLILFFVQVGLPMMGIQQNFWGAAISWLIIVCLSLRIIWRWRGLANFRNATKILISVMLIAGVAYLVYAPMRKTYFTTVKPSWIYIVPSPSLVECQRRAFLIKHVGLTTIPNPDVVLWDNNANKGHAEHYSEIGPDTSLAPKYFWWEPSHPWDEDYTISITSGDNHIVQHLLARTSHGKLQFASEVELNGKSVFRCRDPLIPYYYTVADDTDAPPCDASMSIADEVSQRFEPKSDNYQNPNGSLVILTPKTLSTAPGSEGHSEVRHLWEYQKTWIQWGLAKYPGTRVLVLASDTGTETWNFAQDLSAALRDARWTVEGPRKLPAVYNGILDVQVSTDNQLPARPEATSLVDALTRAGIKQHNGFVYDPDILRGMLVIWVGSRSPDGFLNQCMGAPFNSKAMTQHPCLMVSQIAGVGKSCPFPPP